MIENLTLERARFYQEMESAPFVNMILKVRNFERPSYLIEGNSLRLIDDGLTEKERDIIKQCEDIIESIRNKYLSRVDQSRTPCTPQV